MDDPKVVVFDISSDEEMSRGETRGGCDEDDYGWITELLDGVDKESDDSDDVVVVGEVLLNQKPRGSSFVKSVIPKVVDDDDDCMVLDGDPDKPVPVENDYTEGDEDDLVVVSEKGQVACRDYPHPRHLCAKFPFASTPHDSHCDQCHCYVCDSLAPCVHWGTGISNVDHCRATDKDELWKVLRKSLKKNGIAPPSISGLPDTSLTSGLLQMNQITPLSPLELNPVPQHQICRPTFSRPCSPSTNFFIPNIINQSRTQRHVPRVKSQPYLVPEQLRNTCHIVSPRDRRHGDSVGKVGPQITSPRAAFKRTGSVGLANRSGYRSTYNNYGSQYSRNPSRTSSHNNPIMCQDFRSLMITPASNTSTSSSQLDTGTIAANPVPSRPRLSSQHNGSTFSNSVSSQPQVSPRSYTGTTFANSVSSQAQVSSQSNWGSNYTSSVSYQTEVFSQLDGGNNYANTVPSEAQVFSESGVDCSNFANSVSSQAEIFPLSDAGNNYANLEPFQAQVFSESDVGCNFSISVSSQAQVFSELGVGIAYSNPISSEAQVFSESAVSSACANSVSSQNQVFSESGVGSAYANPLSSQAQVFSESAVGYANSVPSQPEVYIQSASMSNDSQNAVDINLTSWVTPTCQYNQEPPTENSRSRLQSVTSTDELSNVTEFDPPFGASANPGSLEFGFDSWMFEDQHVSGALEVSVPLGLNTLSPEPTSIDAGSLFDL